MFQYDAWQISTKKTFEVQVVRSIEEARVIRNRDTLRAAFLRKWTVGVSWQWSIVGHLKSELAENYERIG